MTTAKVPVAVRLRLPDGREFDVASDAEPDKEPYPGDHPFSGTIFYWTAGNNECDCNRSLYLNRQHDLKLGERDNHFDEHCLPCGDTIELVSMTIGGEKVYP